MEEKLVDTLYNTQPVLDRYKKFQIMPMNNEELAAFKSKVKKNLWQNKELVEVT